MKLTSNSNEHYTPMPIISCVEKLFQSPIDLDVFSSEAADKEIRAKKFYTIKDDAFKQSWQAQNVFCNPPGGVLNGRSLQAMCWDKFYFEYLNYAFVEGFFVGFSIEILCKRGYEILNYPFCIPQPHANECISGMGRIKFETVINEERVIGNSPQHGNVLIYLPPMINLYGLAVYDHSIQLFKEIFDPEIGKVVIPNNC